MTCILVGAGNRGKTYTQYAAECPDRMKVIGVAEPREFHRTYVAQRHGIPSEMQFSDWRQVAERGSRLADFVIIATQDSMHTEPAIAFAGLGYHILLEKPMAPTEEECRRIHKAVTDANVTFAVCHVLRYTPYMQRIKDIIASGAIGDVISLQHLEPVGHWHFAHSYVRGNWRNESESSFILLAKSCHDIDLIRYMMDRPCTRVSSFGSLAHFRPDAKPVGGGSRCLDCAVEQSCPYSAKQLYLDPVVRGKPRWPSSVIAEHTTVEGITRALREGPYGRCVYECDNDVCDNQVVNLEFTEGRTASFHLAAFTKDVCVRSTRVFGTHGELVGDGVRQIVQHDFLSGDRVVHTAEGPPDETAMWSHDGADYFLIRAFVAALQTGDRSRILSGPDETLESHLMTFAAERARKQGQVVALDPPTASPSPHVPPMSPAPTATA